jgi:predicted nucleic acid-binding Zn ribbon protein
MRRRAPRPIALALDDLRAQLAPATLLAEVQAAWPAAVGEALATAGTPVSERDGTVVIACHEAVWAQEIDLMSERLVEALNGRLGRRAVQRLRVQARPPRG